MLSGKLQGHKQQSSSIQSHRFKLGPAQVSRKHSSLTRVKEYYSKPPSVRLSQTVAAPASSGPTSESHSVLQPTGTTIVSRPLSMLDVDEELWQVLDMCSDDELELVYNILHSSSPFSPVIKSIVSEKEPALVELRGRISVMHKVESRFRFLAADPSSMIQGRRPRYRDALLSIRDRVEVQCSSNLNTYDLETEIFLHIMQNCLEYVQDSSDPDPSEAASAAFMAEGDGMSSTKPKGSNWSERLSAPFKFGMKELVPTLVKFGSALTVTAAGQRAIQQLGLQLITKQLKYQVTAKAVTEMAKGAVATWSRQAVLETAQRGVTMATARYSVMQGALAFLGPIMWGSLALDLALKAIGTDYARIIRAVFILAQVRLVRTQGFVQATTIASSDIAVVP